ncbi:hypothetical protein [Streptacidiphilus sp. P02-A3a]|uniref:hypothetical protein n=1 Tax=Streptacidiphilus sp. P02-A3a TaxID=2704468 RepID=UPI0015F9FE36|nr:hypothetical protein [Streptacidiphilus sp. P02-A3a]QMU72006.1 hypothetical protein GXP74_31005 [Streptacidiphilus sp. P02-A3a]
MRRDSSGRRDVRRELAEEDLRGLAGRGFPVYAPTEPGADAAALPSYQHVDGALVEVALSHGSWLAAEGPYVAVRTMTGAATAEHGGAESLADVVEDERDRIFSHAGVDEAAGPGPTTESEVWIDVDGVPVRAALRAEGPLWAARLSLGGTAAGDAAGAAAGAAVADAVAAAAGHPGEPVVVTVIGRGIAPERVGLRTAVELEPYALGRQRELDAVRSRRGRPVSVRDRELPPVQGLEAHRQLVERSVRQSLQLEADLRAGRKPRSPRGDHAVAGELWERTVRQQMRLAGEDRATANEAVTALVNQVVLLAERADWFPGTAAGAAAVEECIRYTVFDSEVPSVAAQRAWGADWTRRMGEAGQLPGQGPEFVRERMHRNLRARADVLGLWQEWYARQQT